MKHNYWLVGANWSGEDQADTFYRRGYWELGWSDDDQPNFAQRRDNIRKDDRIALKARRGRGADTITIKALGVVKEVGEDKRVYIDWLLTKLEREVASKGCYGSIHGPYGSDREPDWVKEVFHI